MASAKLADVHGELSATRRSASWAPPRARIDVPEVCPPELADYAALGA
jgi:hypothetical protein